MRASIQRYYRLPARESTSRRESPWENSMVWLPPPRQAEHGRTSYTCREARKVWYDRADVVLPLQCNRSYRSLPVHPLALLWKLCPFHGSCRGQEHPFGQQFFLQPGTGFPLCVALETIAISRKRCARIPPRHSRLQCCFREIRRLSPLYPLDWCSGNILLKAVPSSDH